jgi:hypothetical protein
MASPAASVAHEVVRRLIKHLDNDSGTDQAPGTMTVPASTYTDPARWEQDRKLLRVTPTVVALSAELRDPGSYKTSDLGGLPVIVTRGADGTADPIRHVNLLYYVFPNTVPAVQRRHVAGTARDLAGDSAMLFNFFTIGDDPSMSAAQQQRFQFALDVTREEDNPAAEGSYRNFAGQPDRPIVFGRNEVCLQHLYRYLDEATRATALTPA